MPAKQKTFFALISIALLGLMAFFAPLAPAGWKSACACIPRDLDFMHFLSLNIDQASYPEPLDLDKLGGQAVAAGFLQKIPIGSSLEKVKEVSGSLQSNCQRMDIRAYQCDYWLQSNRTSERGYTVTFHLSQHQNLQSVDARLVTREHSSKYWF
ncbi:hypothetical protein ASF11_05450 [Acidovorax sp. Leaf76]|uniref:hypothetical protein n=1 Tax=unclassified Acidovorax TaxID=2684926 RepID=UPI0006F929C2|nr:MULTISPECIES: hypothetical protein [unclassified Acidovorax]KQO21865.1 hypothetical protein ASF11_05450 [Acidovorax sp. Leaf76]KQO34935.1 hypothetical protein ASF19_04325 [Acidovorax sp. Leaf84]KQS34720.1 hypothetical protein ASG27_04565 [Acidovorax sp. Leaf191]